MEGHHDGPHASHFTLHPSLFTLHSLYTLGARVRPWDSDVVRYMMSSMVHDILESGPTRQFCQWAEDSRSVAVDADADADLTLAQIRIQMQMRVRGKMRV